jgi:hypothetical protein
MNVKYRFLIVLLIIGIFLIYNQWPCIMTSISGFPASITHKVKIHNTKIALIYGLGICGTCPSGQFISELSKEKNVLYVVPEELSNHEVENLKDAFDIAGAVTRGNEETVTFLKRVSKCSKLNTWRKNFYVELDENKKLKSIVPF